VRFIVGCGWLLLAVPPAAAVAQHHGALASPRADSTSRKSGSELLSRTNEDGQPTRMPSLPRGMTLETIRAGDSVFHGKGHCFACHGADGEGLPNAGSAVTIGLNFVPAEWQVIDSLIMLGIPESVTRSAIAMPPRGGKSDLSTDEVRDVAAYIWVISQVQDEPWPGGHRSHVNMVPAAALVGTARDSP
jgi:cytochrome c5